MDFNKLQAVYVDGFNRDSLNLFMHAAVYDMSDFFDIPSIDTESLNKFRKELCGHWANMNQILDYAAQMVLHSDLPLLKSIDVNEHDIIYYLDANKLPSPNDLRLIKKLLLCNVYKYINNIYYDKFKDHKEIFDCIVLLNEQILMTIECNAIMSLAYFYNDEKGNHCILSDDIYNRSLEEYAIELKSYITEHIDRDTLKEIAVSSQKEKEALITIAKGMQ